MEMKSGPHSGTVRSKHLQFPSYKWPPNDDYTTAEAYTRPSPTNHSTIPVTLRIAPFSAISITIADGNCLDKAGS
jgi:hypothetical protein